MDNGDTVCIRQLSQLLSPKLMTSSFFTNVNIIIQHKNLWREFSFILVNGTNMVHDLFLVYFVNFIYNLYMFWTYPGPSRGGTTVFMRHLTFVILYSWPPGILHRASSWFHLQDHRDARSTEHKKDRNLHTKRLQNTTSHFNIILHSTAISPQVFSWGPPI